MNPSWNIEEIVREVLAALASQRPGGGAGSAEPAQPTAIPAGCPPDRPASFSANDPKSERGSSSAGPDGAASGSAAASSSGSGPSEDGQLRVASRLVTLADLRACGVPENLAGVRRLVVRPDALLTPLLRDELERRHIPVVPDLNLVSQHGADSPAGIPLVSESAGEGRSELPATPRAGALQENTPGAAQRANRPCRLLVIVHGKAYEPAGLVRRLGGEGTPVEVRQMDCILRATDELAEAVRKDHCLGVLLTRYAAIGVCAANRHPGVRAVWGLEVGQAAADAASLGANLLVINPRQTSPYQLHKMIQEFYRAGVHPCPEALKSRLE